MIKIVADNRIPFLKGVLEPYAEVKYLAGAKTGESDVIEADALITRTRTKCNSALLDNSKVRYIATATIGFDHIDAAYCEKNNIRWSNAPGCNSGSVLQYIASVFALLHTKKNFDFESTTLGVIGVGNVGKKIKLLAECLGMKVLLNDPPRQDAGDQEEFVDIKTIQEQADIITFHVPLQTDGKYNTFHMGDSLFFEQCKKKPVIINTCRGEVIDNVELLNALNEHLISDVILDVWENEPKINQELFNKSFIATPHIAGYSIDGKANGTAMSVQAISRFFDLPLKSWFPDSLPVPENATISINATDQKTQDILCEFFIHTYPIERDDQRLRKDLFSFEEQRGTYPVRREFNAYNVVLQNGSELVEEALNKLGVTDVQLIIKDNLKGNMVG